MDSSVSKALQDKLYDKRKAGALEYVLSLSVHCCFFAISCKQVSQTGAKHELPVWPHASTNKFER